MPASISRTRCTKQRQIRATARLSVPMTSPPPQSYSTAGRGRCATTLPSARAPVRAHMRAPGHSAPAEGPPVTQRAPRVHARTRARAPATGIAGRRVRPLPQATARAPRPAQRRLHGACSALAPAGDAGTHHHLAELLEVIFRKILASAHFRDPRVEIGAHRAGCPMLSTLRAAPRPLGNRAPSSLAAPLRVLLFFSF